MVTQKDYSKILVDAAQSVLLEVVRVLGEYQNEIVVIGGWVPQLLIPQAQERHVGSIDVDLAVNHQAVSEIGYETILEALTSRGYQKDEWQPFIFYRSVVVDGEQIRVQVDLLAGEYGGTGRSRRTQIAQDTRFRKARGADLVFHLPEKIRITGKLPDGGQDAAEIQVASLPTFIAMKAFAMKTRLKEKDPWDIYYCLKHYPGGLDKIIQEFRRICEHALALEAISILAEKFGSIDAVGPVHVAVFEDVLDPEERAFYSGTPLNGCST